MQDPKSILLHLDGSKGAMARVQVASQLAELFDARVNAVHCALPALLRYPLGLEGGTLAATTLVELDEDGRRAVQAAFAIASAGSPRLVWSPLQGDSFGGFSQQALYNDLLILGQRNPDDPADGELPPDFLPDLLIGTGKPALLLPYASDAGDASAAPSIGRSVLVAWKPGRESARAVSASLPWLRRAQSVHVIAYGDAVDAPLRSLQAYLRTHGVGTTLQQGGPEDGAPGEALLSQAADLGADLLVMGCYGHSRTREWVLGGATRTVLKSMTLPVLMVH